MSELKERLRRAAAEHGVGETGMDTVLKDHFNHEGMLGFVMSVEEEFNLQIFDEEAERFETLGDVLEYIEENAV